MERLMVVFYLVVALGAFVRLHQLGEGKVSPWAQMFLGACWPVLLGMAVADKATEPKS